MATMTASAEAVHCGCCGRGLPRAQAVELMNTSGVFICTRCAVWAATRSALGPGRVQRVRETLHGLRHRLLGQRHDHAHGNVDLFRGVIPILTTHDVDRTCAFYVRVGFELVERYDDGYLLMNAGDSEIHFAKDTVANAPGEMFVRSVDAAALWKQLKAEGIEGLGPVEDQPWGMREFVITDPDENRIRFGSNLPE